MNNSNDGARELTKVVPTNLHVCGDVKYPFFMPGQESFDKHHCMLCNLTRSQILTFHQTSLDNTRRNGLVFWTNSLVCAKVLEEKQKDMNDENYGSVGMKEHPLLLTMPVSRIIILLLQFFLG